MQSHAPLDQAHEQVRTHVAELLAEAARDRLARAIRPTPTLLTAFGALLVALGQILLRAGVKLGGRPTAPGLLG